MFSHPHSLPLLSLPPPLPLPPLSNAFSLAPPPSCPSSIALLTIAFLFCPKFLCYYLTCLFFLLFVVVFILVRDFSFLILRVLNDFLFVLASSLVYFVLLLFFPFFFL